MIASYLGLFLAGAMFLALGLLVSSLVRNQMVAALVALAVSLLFIVAGFWRTDMDTGSPLYRVIYFFSVPCTSAGTSAAALSTRGTWCCTAASRCSACS